MKIDFQYSTDFYGMNSAELSHTCMHLICLAGEGSFVFNEHCYHIVKNDLVVIPMPNRVRNLAAHDNCVDYIVTHCCSSSTQAVIGGGKFTTDVATRYLEDIKQSVKFKKWFFGHYHDNKNVNANEILIYEQIIRIS